MLSQWQLLLALFIILYFFHFILWEICSATFLGIMTSVCKKMEVLKLCHCCGGLFPISPTNQLPRKMSPDVKIDPSCLSASLEPS